MAQPRVTFPWSQSPSAAAPHGRGGLHRVPAGTRRPGQEAVVQDGRRGAGRCGRLRARDRGGQGPSPRSGAAGNSGALAGWGPGGQEAQRLARVLVRGAPLKCHRSDGRSIGRVRAFSRSREARQCRDLSFRVAERWAARLRGLWGLLQVRYGSFPLGPATPCLANNSIRE